MNKKSFYLLAGILVMVISTTSAQFSKGDKIWNLGVGLNSAYNGGLPLHTSLEFGVGKAISFGPSLDFVSNSYSYINPVTGQKVSYGFTAFYGGLRLSYHFNELFKLNVEELDLYGGGSLGYRSFTWKNSNTLNLGGTYGSGAFFSLHAGARWYFSPAFGVFLELGYGGLSNARGGIALKF